MKRTLEPNRKKDREWPAMKKRGSEIVVQALEDAGARFAFGIPGTHNIELYDAMAQSDKVSPVLVTDEQSASFMADAVSRSSESVGVVNVVPGAGVSHCLSGVAEAFMDNIPVVVLTAGIRNDTGAAYQLHDIDQLAMLKPVTKATFKVEQPGSLYRTVREAFDLALDGAPGPVAVEVPANYYMLVQNVEQEAYRGVEQRKPIPSDDLMEQVVNIIKMAQHPVLYVGNGARKAVDELINVAEILGAPVATTIQGKGVFPENHPLWLWNGLGKSAPPFVKDISDSCDCLLAIGCRFGEVATGSYGMSAPENLIHVDIEPEVFNKNYPVKVAVEADAGVFLAALAERLSGVSRKADERSRLAKGHAAVQKERARQTSDGRVPPAAFFAAISEAAGEDAIYTSDSGNGTFLAMEHLRLIAPGRFLAPVDYSCMGYAVPAAIGAKAANPERDVIAFAGDGALLMTGLEGLTAATYGLGVVTFVLRDGELAQIAQFQNIALARKTCASLPDYEVEKLALATNSAFLKMEAGDNLTAIAREAIEIGRTGKPVMVDVSIDYSHKTFFTKGVVATNFWRLPWQDRLRFVGRAVGRRLGG